MAIPSFNPAPPPTPHFPPPSYPRPVIKCPIQYSHSLYSTSKENIFAFSCSFTGPFPLNKFPTLLPTLFSYLRSPILTIQIFCFPVFFFAVHFLPLFTSLLSTFFLFYFIAVYFDPSFLPTFLKVLSCLCYFTVSLFFPLSLVIFSAYLSTFFLQYCPLFQLFSYLRPTLLPNLVYSLFLIFLRCFFFL